MKKTIIYVYYIFCFFTIYLISSFKEEAFIDGIEIKNACIAHRAFVVDDIRDITVIFAIIILIPCFVYLKRSRFKNKFFNLLSLLLIIYFFWRFFIRLNVC
ncbi:membrane protein [Yersinia similis]|uniref:Membrane protein n=1 Tax=Yersinia similis TaxID=367190 RepID=A0ABM5PUQ7_9GAMM|nr:YjeO family protein [Yersinia similis]AHK18546.1 membrane protein [Yersinia similis]CFQ71220.1 Inner membrane protein yjeO [Yersinia similis]CNC46942.1 Inner membrane protein yjeO [Yersinia similis]